MKPILQLNSEDDSSGCTIFDNGTKAYWSEGPSNVEIVYADGKTETVPTGVPHHPVLGVLGEIGVSVEVPPARYMTPAEEQELRITRGYAPLESRV